MQNVTLAMISMSKQTDTQTYQSQKHVTVSFTHNIHCKHYQKTVSESRYKNNSRTQLARMSAMAKLKMQLSEIVRNTGITITN